MQKILFIGAVWPEPKSSAGGTRLMQLLNLFLKNNWQVTYASATAESEFAEDIQSLGIDQKSIELNNESFNAFVKELNPEVVIFDRFTMEEQFGWRVAEACPNALRIIETIDLHCLRLCRQQVLKTKENLIDTLLSADISKREMASMYRSDLNLIISDAEMDWLKDVFKFNKDLLFYLPYKIQNESIVWSELPGYESRQDFVTIGNFKHEPNWDSVRYLKEKIWPLILKKMPNVQLKVYGSYASQKVEQLHNPKEGFYIMGRAEDALEVMKNARVCLAPLRFGAGIKGKLAEAMLCGTPSITSEVGVEGLKGGMLWNGFVTEDAQEFADQAIAFYQNKTEWEQAQQNGFNILKSRFSDMSAEKDLVKKIAELQNNLSKHRQTNFIGSMLMHHSIQSTKYLSKWIEEKNK